MSSRIIKNIIQLITCTVFITVCFSQTKSDPRMLGMGGAYSTVARGYNSVGINPANLAFNKTLQFGIPFLGNNVSFVNNMFSIETYNQLSGSNLEDINSEDYYEKKDIFRLTKNEGLRFNLYNQMPIINISKGIFAFNSDFILISNFGVPEGFLDLLFNGISADPDPAISDIGNDFNFDFKEDVLGVNEFAFSMGIPYENFGLGVTLKYLQGLFYLGIDQDSSYATLKVDSTEVSGNGRILFRQAIGGGGVGLDLGFITKRNDYGWKFGFSFINLMSKIHWNKPNITRNLLGETIESYMPYRQNEYFLYQYEIDNVSAESLFGQAGGIDSLFQTWSYTVVEDPDFGLIITSAEEFTDLNGNNEYDEGEPFIDCQSIICEDDNNWEDGMGNGQWDDELDGDKNLEERNLKDFTTQYPAFFRMGLSKLIEGQALFAMDVYTGFSDNYNSYSNWKFSFGTEIFKFKNIIYRLGYSFGGNNSSDLSYGMGYVIGPFFGQKIDVDLALGFKNSIFINKAQGLDFSIGFNWTKQ